MLCNSQQSHLQQCTCVRPRAHTHTRRARLVRSLTRTRMHAQSFESPNHSEAPTHVRARAHTHTHTHKYKHKHCLFFSVGASCSKENSLLRARTCSITCTHTHTYKTCWSSPDSCQRWSMEQGHTCPLLASCTRALRYWRSLLPGLLSATELAQLYRAI